MAVTAGAFSTWLSTQWLKFLFNNDTFTPLSEFYLALFTGDPGDSSPFSPSNEVTGLGYARKACKGNFTSAASSRIISNSTDITFAKALGSWGTVTHWALCTTDGSTPGEILVRGAFSSSKTITTNQVAKILLGDIDIAVTASGEEGGMNTVLANEMLDHTFLKDDSGYTRGSMYLALGKLTFGDAGTWDEENEIANAGNYARVNVYSPGIPLNRFGTASSGLVKNNADISFNSATANWGTVSHWALASSDTYNAGTMLMWGKWALAQSIDIDDQVTILSNQLSISLT